MENPFKRDDLVVIKDGCLEELINLNQSNLDLILEWYFDRTVLTVTSVFVSAVSIRADKSLVVEIPYKYVEYKTDENTIRTSDVNVSFKGLI